MVQHGHCVSQGRLAAHTATASRHAQQFGTAAVKFVVARDRVEQRGAAGLHDRPKELPRCLVLAVVPGSAGVREAASGNAREVVRGGAGESQPARLVVNRREEIEVEIEAPADGVLFLRRAWLPLWRAAIDGEPAPTVIAQVARLGVAVPAGSHRVRFWIDRRPLLVGLGLSALGCALLVLLLVRSPLAPRRAPLAAIGSDPGGSIPGA